MNFFKNVYEYREFLKTSVKKDVRGKYKKSALGVLWSFLNPLLQMAVYAFVFGKILNVGEPNYTVFICCGLIPWNFFCAAINRATYTIVENGGIIKKVYFPRELLPISVVSSEAVNFVISSIIIVAFVLFSGLGISWTWIFYPLLLLILYVFLISIAFFLSAMTVYFRDLQHFTGIFLQLMFYATPIAYAGARVPGKFSFILKLNPVAYIIDGFRKIFMEHQIPELLPLLVILLIGFGLCVIGYMFFNKMQKGFAEEL